MQNMKTVSFGAAFSLTRPEPADYTDADGNTQTAAPNVPRFNYSDGIAEGLLLDSLLTETAAIIDVPMFNPMEGTWVFSAEMENCRPLPGSGFEELLTGSGTLVFTYSWRDGRRLGQCWANGELLYTVDPITAGQATHLTTGGNAQMHRVAYLPAAWSDAEAAEAATGAFEIVAPWDFEADYENQRYGSRDEDGAFIYRAFSDEHTFTRPSPKNLLVDGQFVTYPAGEPAFGDDGISLEYSSVNVARYSRDVREWAFSPDAAATDESHIECLGSADIFFTGNFPALEGETYTGSVGIRLASGTIESDDDVRIVLDDSQSSPLQINNVGDLLADGQVHVLTATGTLAQDTTQLRSYVRWNADRSAVFEIIYGQCEKGPVATSPIITEADPVTRAADLLSIEDLQSKDWWGSPDAITIVLDMTPIETSDGNDQYISLAGRAIGSNGQQPYNLSSFDGIENMVIPNAFERGRRVRIALSFNETSRAMAANWTGLNNPDYIEGSHNGSFLDAPEMGIIPSLELCTVVHSIRVSRLFITGAELQELTQ